MDRTQQRAEFTNAIQPFFSAQDASDAAADKASATKAELEQATTAYNKAKQTGPASKVELLSTAVLKLQEQYSTEMAAAQTAYLASQNAWVPLDKACGNLMQNPGAVEQP